MATRWLRIVLLVVLLLLAQAPAARRVDAADIRSKMQALADKAIAGGLVGVSIAVYKPNLGVVLAAAGESDKEAGTKLTTTDIARIASCSKVWVGAVVMQLIQEGKIAPTDKVARYLPEDEVKRIANADTATVGQLLSHTSGIVDYYNDSDFGTDVPDKTDFTIPEALRYIWDKPAVFEPGARYSYSNTNTVLLALLIENVTGHPFYEELRSRIYTPLGLKHTYVEMFEPVPVKIVRGYEFSGKRDFTVTGDRYQGRGLPDGAIVTSPEDMALFMRGLFGDDKLLSKVTVQQMVTPVADTDDGSKVGFHIFITRTDFGNRYEHDGAIDGYRAEEMFYPGSGTAIAYWTNSGGRTQDDVFDGLQQAITNVVLGGQ